jgi:ketosteroid isomerase-like protein
MSHPNRELLAKIYDSLAQGEVGTLVASLADDIEWRVHRPSPVAGTYKGEHEVVGFFPRMLAPYTLRVRVRAIVADTKRGFVSVRESAERPMKGLTWTGVHVWEFRDGKIARFESYYDDASLSSGLHGPRQAQTRTPEASKRGTARRAQDRGRARPSRALRDDRLLVAQMVDRGSSNGRAFR